MSQSVAEFVDGIDGVRGGVAEAVGQKFDTVAALSEAKPEALTAVKGVGPVLAERILEAARTAVISDHTPEDEPKPAPDTRARAATEQARAAARPALDVIDGGAEQVADEGETVAEADDDADLPRVVERPATLVGTTLGWGIRAYRSVSRPVRSLLKR